jgi:sugar lactone lactonase YvrE
MWKMFRELVRPSASRPRGLPTRSSKSQALRALAVENLEDRLCLSQYLLVTDASNNSIVRYDGTDSHFIDTFVPAATSGMLEPDLGIIPDLSGQDFLVDGVLSHNITRYRLADGTPDPAPGQSGANFVPPGSGGLAGPEGIAFGANGDLYVSNNTNPGGDILRYDGTTGAFMDDFLDAGRRRGEANDLHIGPDGNLYVDNFASPGQLFRFDQTTGAFLPGQGQRGPNFISHTGGGANGFAWGPDGNLYLAFDANLAGPGSILRYDGATGQPLPAPGQTGAVFVPAGSGGVQFIDGITFGDDGNLYVTDQPGGVLKYDGVTGSFLGTFVSAGSGGLGTAGGLLFYNSPAGATAHHDSVPLSPALATGLPATALADGINVVGQTQPAAPTFQPPVLSDPALASSAATRQQSSDPYAPGHPQLTQPTDAAEGLDAGDLNSLGLNLIVGS